MWKKIGRGVGNGLRIYLKKRMNIECKIVGCRESGAVIVIKLDSKEGKKG